MPKGNMSKSAGKLLLLQHPSVATWRKYVWMLYTHRFVILHVILCWPKNWTFWVNLPEYICVHLLLKVSALCLQILLLWTYYKRIIIGYYYYYYYKSRQGIWLDTTCRNKKSNSVGRDCDLERRWKCLPERVVGLTLHSCHYRALLVHYSVFTLPERLTSPPAKLFWMFLRTGSGNDPSPISLVQPCGACEEFCSSWFNSSHFFCRFMQEGSSLSHIIVQ